MRTSGHKQARYALTLTDSLPETSPGRTGLLMTAREVLSEYRSSHHGREGKHDAERIELQDARNRSLADRLRNAVDDVEDDHRTQ